MELKEIISKNIHLLRKHNKMTQLELSEKVNYSDKAVSRWESGDVTPDIGTLNELAKIFEVPLCKLLEEPINVDTLEKETRRKRINKLVIALLGITVIWTAATIIYLYSMVLNNSYYWLIFIYAIPSTFFLAAIFNIIWGKKRYTYILASALIWTLILSIYIATLPTDIWPIWILGAPSQVVIILWSKLHS